MEVREPYHPETALATLVPDRPDVLYVGVDPITASPRAQILHFATRHGVPAIQTTRTVVDAGGLLSYGPHVSALSAWAATYVDRLLKGSKPAPLPVERPTTVELAINLRTAQVLGLTISPALLFQADELVR